MGKYARLKKEHDELKFKFDKLVTTLLGNGSIVKPRIFPAYGAMYSGEHTSKILKLEQRIKAIEEYLGVELISIKIAEVNKIEYRFTGGRIVNE